MPLARLNPGNPSEEGSVRAIALAMPVPDRTADDHDSRLPIAQVPRNRSWRKVTAKSWSRERGVPGAVARGNDNLFPGWARSSSCFTQPERTMKVSSLPRARIFVWFAPAVVGFFGCGGTATSSPPGTKDDAAALSAGGVAARAKTRSARAVAPPARAAQLRDRVAPLVPAAARPARVAFLAPAAARPARVAFLAPAAARPARVAAPAAPEARPCNGRSDHCDGRVDHRHGRQHDRQRRQPGNRGPQWKRWYGRRRWHS